MSIDCEHDFKAPRIHVDEHTGQEFEVAECRYCNAGTIRAVDPRTDTAEFIAQRLRDLGCMP